MLKGNFPIEKFKNLRTPFYYYDMALLKSTLDTIKSLLESYPDFHLHYAVKANFDPVILKTISSYGFGADCVSGGEVSAAINGGFSNDSIVFAGVGKSDEEIRLALSCGIARFNVESVEELEVINDIALSMGKRAPVSLRVNPDIGAHTHAGITTGLSENKFGIGYEMLLPVISRALELKGIEYRGLHFHIGSQILDMDDFIALCNRINSLKKEILTAGLPLGDVNVGGGLGVNYEHPNHFPMADFKEYFKTFKTHLDLPEGTPVHFELGRSIVAPCGTLISKVLYVKKGASKRFAIIDGSMTELIRPAMYKAYHRVENISCNSGIEDTYDVVGPVCESSDVFLKGTVLDECHRGDYIAIRTAGAYGRSMSSQYNLHPLPDSFYEQ